MKPLVTVCTPVYEGERWVAETVESLLAQSEPKFRALLSVEPSSDRSLAICRRFAADPRITLIEQPVRLGWVGHVRDLVGRVETDWLLLLSHDDLLDPDCLARLLGRAAREADAAAIYGDCRTFGELDGQVFREPELRGEPVTRVLTYLVEHFNALAFRGLLRTAPARASGGLVGNPFDDFASESVWSLKLAWQGEFARIPEPLWSKRYVEGSVHDRWARWPAERGASAWAHHCAQMAAFVASLGLPERSLDLLLHACLYRLFRSSSTLGPWAEISGFDAPRRELHFAEFRQSLETLGEEGILAGRRIEQLLPAQTGS